MSHVAKTKKPLFSHLEQGFFVFFFLFSTFPQSGAPLSLHPTTRRFPRHLLLIENKLLIIVIALPEKF
jgi:hypothetical protein